jgi:hypothetical protein
LIATSSHHKFIEAVSGFKALTPNIYNLKKVAIITYVLAKALLVTVSDKRSG